MQRVLIEEQIRCMATIEALHDEQTKICIKETQRVRYSVADKTDIDHDNRRHILPGCQREVNT